jgi:hypothetical protein
VTICDFRFWIKDMLTILPNDENKPLLTLFDGQLSVDVGFEQPGEAFDDNITFFLRESCPPDMKLLKADEVSFNLTSTQARMLAQSLLDAATKNDQWLAHHE